MKFLVVLSCTLAIACAASTSSQWKDLPKSKRSFASLHGLVGDNVLSAQIAEAKQVLQFSMPPQYAQQSFLPPSFQQNQQLLPPHQTQLRQSQNGYSNQVPSPPQSASLNSVAPPQRDLLPALPEESSVDLQSSPLPLLPPKNQLVSVTPQPLTVPAPVHHHLVHAQQEHVHIQQHSIPAPQPQEHVHIQQHLVPAPQPQEHVHIQQHLVPAPQPQEHVHIQQHLVPAPQPQEHVHIQPQLVPAPQAILPPVAVENVAIQTHQFPTQVLQTALPSSVATLTLQDLENIRAYLLGPSGHASIVTESRHAIPLAQHQVATVPVQHAEIHEHVQLPSIPVQPLPQPQVHSSPVSLQQLQQAQFQAVAEAQSQALQQQQQAQLEAEAQIQSQLHQVVEAKRNQQNQHQPSSVYLPASH